MLIERSSRRLMIVATTTVGLSLASCASAPLAPRTSSSSSTLQSLTISSTPPQIPSAPVVEGDISDAQRQDVQRLTDSLPQPNAVASLSFEPPTQTELSGATPGADPNGLFITATTPVTDTIDEIRAEWQTELIVSAVWKDFADQTLGSIAGGILETPNIADSDAQSTETWFTASSNPLRFTNADGDPSSLNIAPAEVRDQLNAMASKTGAQVTNTSFGSLLGTDVIVDLTIPDPQAWAEALGVGSMLGDIDSQNLEGVMYVIRDADGNLIKCTTYSTGYEEGSALYGAAYDEPPFTRLAGPVTTPAPQPS